MKLQKADSSISSIISELPPISMVSRVCSSSEIDYLINRIINVVETERKKFEVWDIQSAEQYGMIAEAGPSALKRIHSELNRIEMERFIAASSVSTLHRNCTEYRDQLASRALSIVLAEMESDGKGTPPLDFALISMGSDGREEQTLITDQDYLIVYGDGGGESADAWFAEFGNRLVDCLEIAGFKRCTGDIMTSNPTWRGSFTQWRKRLFAIVRYEVEDFAKNMMDLIVLSDARFVAGDRVIAGKRIELIRDMETEHLQVM